MIVALLVLVALACAGGLAAGVVAWSPRLRSTDRLLADRLRERFVVTMASSESFSGLLASADERSVVLIDCQVFSQDGTRKSVDGELVLRREAIAYMQRP